MKALKINGKIDIGAIVTASLVLLLVLLATVAAYRTVTRFMARVSADFYYPYFSVLKNTENAIVRRSLLAKNKVDLVRALEILLKENSELAARTSLLYELRQENDQLRSLASIRIRNTHKAVFAENILRDPLTWSSSFTIDKGEADGLRPGDAVLSSMPVPGSDSRIIAFVGRVRSVSKHTAVVATILGEECSVSVTLPETNSFGVLQGSGKNAEIKFLPVDGKYGVGEVVMTSGFADHTPAGLYIGTLEAFPDGASAHVSEGLLYAEARLKPALNIDMIRFVVVLTLQRSEENVLP